MYILYIHIYLDIHFPLVYCSIVRSIILCDHVYLYLGQINLIFRFAGETWKKVGVGVRNKNKNIVNFYKS